MTKSKKITAIPVFTTETCGDGVAKAPQSGGEAMTNSNFSERAEAMGKELVELVQQAVRSGRPQDLATYAGGISSMFGAAEDALAVLTSVADYERLSASTELVQGETCILYSALADIEEGVLDD